MSFSGFTAQLAVAVAIRCRPSCDGAAARGRVIAVKNEGIHKHRTNSIMSTIMPPQPRCSYRNSLYIHVRSKQARRNRTCTCTYVRHRKQEASNIYCARSGFLFVRCVPRYSSLLGLLAPCCSASFHHIPISHSFGRLCMVQAGRARSLGESIDNTELASGTCSD